MASTRALSAKPARTLEESFEEFILPAIVLAIQPFRQGSRDRCRNPGAIANRLTSPLDEGACLFGLQSCLVAKRLQAKTHILFGSNLRSVSEQANSRREAGA